MTVARSAAEVLEGHVTLEVESIDRMYLNLYVPQLQRELGVVGFFKQRGFTFASGAVMQPITNAFLAAIHAFVDEQGVDLVRFKAGERKDDIAQGYLEASDGSEGILFVGVAQEKARLWTTEKRRNPDTGATYPWLVRSTRVVNHYYFYGIDDDFGLFFVKLCSYFPYNGKVLINGHHFAQRQAAKAGIGFEALDNGGFAACDDPDGLQGICDRLDDATINRFVRKWLAILPHPYSGSDRQAGFRYDLSVLQAEFALTQVLDRPLSGRVLFEDIIRHNLDLGRPDRVGLIFDRRVVTRGRFKTPGTFRTRVITDGVTPSLHIDYKHSKIKQYHKLGVALRTETTINDTYDFGIGRRLHNLAALRQVGFAANRRLLDVQRTSHDPAIGSDRLAEVSGPVIVDQDRKAPGLRFGDPRVHALLVVLLSFRLVVEGFTNAQMRSQVADLLGVASLSVGQMTYDLRRLRLHGIIERIPHTFRYRLTGYGLEVATAYTLAHDRVLRPATSQLGDALLPSELRRAYDKFAARSCLAA